MGVAVASGKPLPTAWIAWCTYRVSATELRDDRDAAFDKYSRIDEGLADITDHIPHRGMADAYTTGDTRHWVITIAPDPD
jgi:hypothetical protein